MDLDEDVHLCLRCGRNFFGLDNYISHRQQQYCNMVTPFFTNTSKNAPLAVEQNVEEYTSFSHDISKLSANDFFLSLNLQSNQKASIKNNTENLDIPILEPSDLVQQFIDDKPLNSMIESSIAVGHIAEVVSKTCSDHCVSLKDIFDSEPVINNISQNLLSFETNLLGEVGDNTIDDSDNVIPILHPLLKSMSKFKSINFSNIDCPSIPRTSSRQKNARVCVFAHCGNALLSSVCPFCDVKYSFVFPFLDHLLLCEKKDTDTDLVKLFEYERQFAHLSSFQCHLCLFFCNNPQIFYDHLNLQSHCRKAASLHHPLICLPCLEEGDSSADMRDHFLKNHFQETIYHPVVLAERKQKLHCCYCSSLAKSCDSKCNSSSDLLSDEVVFIKKSLLVMLNCSYGIDKHLLASFRTKIYHLLHNIHESASFPKYCIEGDSSKSLKFVKPYKKSKKNILELDFNPCNDLLINLCTHPTPVPTDFASEIEIYSSEDAGCKNDEEDKDAALQNCNKRNTLEKAKHKSGSLKKFPKNSKLLKKCQKYLCDKCGYVSNTAHHLTRHKRTHTGERPFKCPDCKYSCCLSSQLLRHKRLHSGSRPYKCPYCSYACNTQENLRKHILKTKKHKGKMMYSCRYCNFACNEFSIYRDHLLTLHSKHFPNGERDVLSSSVAGLYEKV